MELSIKKKTFAQICTFFQDTHYETGGIIGKTNDVISEFLPDECQAEEKYEYHPSADFFMKTINGAWMEKNITFVGFVHSHLHNCAISLPDIAYAREILLCNEVLSKLLIGIVDLSARQNNVKWYMVKENRVEEYSFRLVD